ncbi:MAG TPA: MlaD family protein [Nocardia sp.]|uniref:MlaD family protein n=1 Tax=Nocardia sp. TaxID=1821 RepID=UPI002B4B855E|nr:MlaD family protein [Nocardia sp.]HLS76728.1 MlaD family protein [Nocardia sp.]
MTTRALFLRVAAAVLVTAVALVGVFQLVRRPVDGPTVGYTALFTDANGLRVGDDVRMYGVQVGKVRELTLDGGLARARFTVQRDRPVFADSVIAVKYQNLTGFRYLEIVQPEQPSALREPGTVFDTTRTVPAFDITTLFNGLQPVLAQLSPGEINHFTESILAVLHGDGSGIAPALDAIERLSRFASDRQAVISVLVANLARTAELLGGNSGDAVQMLTNLTNLFTSIADKLPGLVEFSLHIPPVIQPVRAMLATLGVTGEPGRDLDLLLRQAFPDPATAVAVFDRLPGLVQSIAAVVPATGPQAEPTCTHGASAAPAPLAILFAGQEVVLCRS